MGALEASPVTASATTCALRVMGFGRLLPVAFAYTTSWGPKVVVSVVKSLLLPICRLPMWAVETDPLHAARASARTGPASRNSFDGRERTEWISFSVGAAGKDSGA